MPQPLVANLMHSSPMQILRVGWVGVQLTLFLHMVLLLPQFWKPAAAQHPDLEVSAPFLLSCPPPPPHACVLIGLYQVPTACNLKRKIARMCESVPKVLVDHLKAIHLYFNLRNQYTTTILLYTPCSTEASLG